MAWLRRRRGSGRARCCGRRSGVLVARFRCRGSGARCWGGRSRRGVRRRRGRSGMRGRTRCGRVTWSFLFLLGAWSLSHPHRAGLRLRKAYAALAEKQRRHDRACDKDVSKFLHKVVSPKEHQWLSL